MTQDTVDTSPDQKEPMFAALTIVQRATLLGLMSPVLTIILVLKAMSVTQHEHIARPWYAWPDLFISDIALFAGISALSFAALGIARSRKFVLPLVQILYIGWMFFELVGYRFYFTTGSTLDWQLIALYIRHIEQLWGMVSVVNAALSRTLLFGLIALFVALPWYLIWRFRHHPPPVNPPRQRHLIAMGILGILLAVIFPLFAQEQRLGRNTLVEIGVSAFDHWRQRASARQHLQLDRSDRKLVPRANEQPKNIVLIFMESTGARVTGPYNPKAKKFTPTLDALASKSLMIDHGHAIVPHTSKALFAVHCSTFPNPTASLTEAGSQGLDAPCLPELLAAQGYDTAYFQGATMFFEDRYSLLRNLGYQHMFGKEELEARGTPFDTLNYFGYESKALLDPAREWLTTRQDQDTPFLLTFLTLAPHHDYRVPKGFEARALHENPEFNHYLNCVAYVDAFISDVMELLEAVGKKEDTLFVIVGDHGEAFGEHGRIYHDNVIYQEALHVPMLIHGPGVSANTHIEQPATQLDLLPTMVSLAGFEPQGTFDGVDLREPPGAPRALVSYCWYERTCAAITQWPYKFIHHYDQLPDELYHLEQDPREREDLIATKRVPDTLDLAQMKQDLLEQIARTQARHEGASAR